MNASDFLNVETRRHVSLSAVLIPDVRSDGDRLAMFWSVLQQRFWSGPAQRESPSGARGAAKSRTRKAAKRVRPLRTGACHGLADGHNKDLEKATAEAAAWQKDVVPLRENFDGRMIAANAALAMQLFRLFEEERAMPEEMAKMRGEMEEAVKLSAKLW